MRSTEHNTLIHQKIKAYRIELTKILNTIFICCLFSNEMDKFADSLKMGKSWLGKVLGKLPKQEPTIPEQEQMKATIGESPYFNSELLNENIEPEADITEDSLEPLFDYKTKNSRVLIIKSLRAHLTKKLEELEEIKRYYSGIEMVYVEKYLTEAKFWLGWELNRIYKERQKYKRNKGEGMSDNQLPIVTFKQSKLLKELGFNYETAYFYTDHKRDQTLDRVGFDKTPAMLRPFEYLAPSIQHAFMWLRNEKKVDVDIFVEDYLKRSYSYTIRYSHLGIFEASIYGFTPYNQTESEALDKALEILSTPAK